MDIAAVEAIPVSVPRDRGVRTSRDAAAGVRDRFDHVIVRLETAAGVVGLGEVAPTPGWPGGLDPETCVDLIDDVLGPVAVGRRVSRPARLVEALRDAAPDGPFPVGGIDVAVHDALGRHVGLPVFDILGGPTDPGRRLPLHRTIGIGPPAAVREAAVAAAGAGVLDLKCKVGGPDSDAELSAVAAIVEAVPGARIRVDANGAWDVDTAVRRIRELDEAAGGLAFVEQPVPADDLAGLHDVREAVPPAIVADEACTAPGDVVRIADAAAADAVNVKLVAAGGFGRARGIATVAAAHGLDVVLGGLWELGVGTAASAHLGIASPELAYPTGIAGHAPPGTLAGPAADWTPDGPALVVPDAPGLGVDLDGEAVERYRTD